MSASTPTPIEIQCNQRKKYQNMIIPSSRFEMLNPYIGSQYTQKDFDMRRKAEILKYLNTSTNSKTNNDTQSQLWKKLIDDISTARKYTKTSIQSVYFLDMDAYLDFYVISTTDYTCNESIIIYKPSSNSDVPGNITLYEDKKVPLYKFKTDTNYAIVADVDTYNFLINSDINYLVLDGQVTSAYYLYSIQPNTTITTITIKVPLSFYVKGTSKILSGTPIISDGTPIDRQISFSLDSINFSIHYNPDLYNSISTSQIENISVAVNKTLNIDISFEYHNQTNNHFQNIQYIDTVDVEIPNIPTGGKFIYDIYVDSKITETINSITDFDTSYGIIFNVEDNYDVSINTTVTNINPPNDPYVPYSVKSNDENDVIETIFKNEYFASLTELSQTTYQEQQDISQNICLYEYSYVDVEKYYTQQSYQNVYVLKRATLTNTIYNVEDIKYNPNVYYTLSKGTYYFVNIPSSHPIAILNSSLIYGNNNDYMITYTNNNDAGYNLYNNNNNNNFNNTEQYQIGPETVYIDVNDPENGDYIFMYGVVKVEVFEDFDKASIYCYNHGFMGNRYLLKYSDSC